MDRMGVKVVLHFTNKIPLGLWFKKPSTTDELATFNQIKQCIEIIVKHGMSMNLVTVGKNPDTFFLPDHCQMQLMGRGRNPFASYYVRRMLLPRTVSCPFLPLTFSSLPYRIDQERMHPVLESSNQLVSAIKESCILRSTTK